jgi:hypothetical protein
MLKRGKRENLDDAATLDPEVVQGLTAYFPKNTERMI